ncbi:hypothetical protein DYB32_003697 [Aphanomyces invadans]|uniref:Uncharacterized protein n=1 Tax=Aphanomyces invadans TaxID=157072 RepID=A0A3R6WNH3_9STRA|nr:hypothetical protein DYB32_003697 [Aphanomyces invadans]
MSGIPNHTNRIVPRTHGLKETGSCFDTTERKHHEDSSHNDPDLVRAFSLSKPIRKETTDQFLRKGTGYGGLADSERIHKRDELVPISPRKEKHQPGAFKERYNPPDTSFRKFYERGDLPIQIDHGGVKNLVAWKVDITKLDFHHYLPIFFDGLREVEEPYAFLSEQAVWGVLSRLILNVVATDNLGDGIDYAQRKQENLGDLIQQTLETFESNGGDDAFINIKYLVPTYQSVCVG